MVSEEEGLQNGLPRAVTKNKGKGECAWFGEETALPFWGACLLYIGARGRTVVKGVRERLPVSVGGKLVCVVVQVG